MAAAVNIGNNAYAGGALYRLSTPTAAAGAIGTPGAGGGNPIAGVAEPSPLFMKNNQMTNIGIPYARVVPMDTAGYGLPATAEGLEAFNSARADPTSFDHTAYRIVRETDDLRAFRLAFILGRRTGTVDIRGGRLTAMEQHFNLVNYNAQQFSGASGKGPDRFQKLASFEFVKRYVELVLIDKVIDLGPVAANGVAAGDIKSTAPTALGVAPALVDTDLIYKVDYLNDKDKDAVNLVGDPNNNNAGSLTDMPDVAKDIAIVRARGGAPTSGIFAQDAAEAGVNLAQAAALKRKQGIFTRDENPFLRGKGVDTSYVDVRSEVDPHPEAISRNLGDELAFYLLDKKLAAEGLMDWVPDGVVLSKLTNGPDVESDAYFDAKDGQLYNLRIQGPALATNWAFNKHLVTLPRDRVYILVVADCFFGISSEDFKAQNPQNPANALAGMDGAGIAAAQKRLRGEHLSKDELVHFETFRKQMMRIETGRNNAPIDPETAFNDGETDGCFLMNFSLRPSTSSEMVGFSGSKAVDSKHVRMGLLAGTGGKECIVGGWLIGTVMDSAASRAVTPETSASVDPFGTATSHALNLNVGIEWCSADELWRRHCNVENTLRSRHEGPGKGITSSANMPPKDRAANNRRLAAAAVAAGLGNPPNPILGFH